MFLYSITIGAEFPFKSFISSTDLNIDKNISFKSSVNKKPCSFSQINSMLILKPPVLTAVSFAKDDEIEALSGDLVESFSAIL